MRSSVVSGLVIAIALGGCAMQRHREQVRQGFLTRGLHRDAFLEEWGRPSRTFSLPAADPVYRAEAFGTMWQRPIYEVWEYPERATCLTFDGVRLILWETAKTDCQPKPASARLQRVTGAAVPSGPLIASAALYRR